MFPRPAAASHFHVPNLLGLTTSCVWKSGTGINVLSGWVGSRRPARNFGDHALLCKLGHHYARGTSLLLSGLGAAALMATAAAAITAAATTSTRDWHAE